MSDRYSLEEFASFIRDAWPEKSADYDDETLAMKFINRYPKAGTALDRESLVKVNNRIVNKGRAIYTGEEVKPMGLADQFMETTAQSFKNFIGKGSASDMAKLALDEATARNPAALVVDRVIRQDGPTTERPLGAQLASARTPGELFGAIKNAEIFPNREAFQRETRQLLPQPEGEVTGAKGFVSQAAGGFTNPLNLLPQGQLAKYLKFAGPMKRALASFGIEVSEDLAIGLVSELAVTGPEALTTQNVLMQGGVAAAVRSVVGIPAFRQRARELADMEAQVKTKAGDRPEFESDVNARLRDEVDELAPEDMIGNEVIGGDKAARGLGKKPEFGQYKRDLEAQEGRPISDDEARQFYEEDFPEKPVRAPRKKTNKKNPEAQPSPDDPYWNTSGDDGGALPNETLALTPAGFTPPDPDAMIEVKKPKSRTKKSAKGEDSAPVDTPSDAAEADIDPDAQRQVELDDLAAFTKADPQTEIAPWESPTREQRAERLELAANKIRQRIANRDMLVTMRWDTKSALKPSDFFLKSSPKTKAEISIAHNAAGGEQLRDNLLLLAYENRIKTLRGEAPSYGVALDRTQRGDVPVGMTKEQAEAFAKKVVNFLWEETPYFGVKRVVIGDYPGRRGSHEYGVLFLNWNLSKQDDLTWRSTALHELRHSAYKARSGKDSVTPRTVEDDWDHLVETEAQSFMGEVKLRLQAMGISPAKPSSLMSMYEWAAKRLKTYGDNNAAKNIQLAERFYRRSDEFMALRNMVLGRKEDKAALANGAIFNALPEDSIVPGVGKGRGGAGGINITAEAKGKVHRNLLWGLDPEMPGIRYERTVNTDLVDSMNNWGYEPSKPVQIYIRPGNKVTVVEGNNRIRAAHASWKVKDIDVEIQFLDGAEADYTGPLIKRESSKFDNTTVAENDSIIVYKNSQNPGPDEVTALSDGEITVDVDDIMNAEADMGDGRPIIEVDKNGDVRLVKGSIKPGQTKVDAEVVYKGGGEGKTKAKSLPKTTQLSKKLREDSVARAATTIAPDTPLEKLQQIAKDLNDTTLKQAVTFDELDNNPAVKKLFNILNEDYGWRRRSASNDGQQVGHILYKPKPKVKKAPRLTRDVKVKKSAPVELDDSVLDEAVDQQSDALGWNPDEGGADTPGGNDNRSFLGKAFDRHFRLAEDYLRERGGLVSRLVGRKFFRSYVYQTRAEASAVYWITNTMQKLGDDKNRIVRQVVTGKIKEDSPQFKLLGDDIKDAAMKVREILDTVIRRARKEGVQTVDGKLVDIIKNYYPEGKFDYDPQYRGWNNRDGTFSAALELHRNPFKEPEYPETQIAENFLAYIRNAYQKIGEVREFGNDPKLTMTRIKEMATPRLSNGKPNPKYIGTAGDDVTMIEMLADKLLFASEKSKYHPDDQKIMRGLTNFVTGSMLGKSGIINYSQSHYAGQLYGDKHLLKAIQVLGSNSKEAQFARRMIAESGSLTDTEAMSLSFNQAPLARFTNSMLNWSFAPGKLKKLSMSAAEIWNREVSALAGLESMEDALAKALEAQKAVKSSSGGTKLRLQQKLSDHIKELKRHGVFVDEALESGSLSYGDKLNIMLIASQKAQHSTSPISTPITWGGGNVFGDIATKFMKYPLKQGWRLRHDLAEGSGKERLAKVARLFTVGTATAGAASAFSDLLSMKNPLEDREVFGVEMPGPIATYVDALAMTFLLDTVFYRLKDVSGGNVAGSLPHIRQVANTVAGLYKMWSAVFEMDPAAAIGADLEMLGKLFNVPGSALAREIGRELQKEPKEESGLGGLEGLEGLDSGLEGM